ncbi:Pentatricopeptide repeat-containing protein, mitochondrial [Sesamum angolense]|uniref:Pentatricopeptide repeat-containing protein, mitochondrial n=1 Tax=Sesamum angolense TaxID=2727404 RepID=A0AAE2BXX5_9LAMI|nr:Pentatricopeptide repeat-containing protein, mitochondrial [Sesamum angolense]
MAARSLLFTLTRNARRGKKVPFRSISSSIEAVEEEPITRTHEDEFAQEEKDDLKSRIFRLRLPKRSVTNVLQKWVSEGNNITVADLRSISRDLRRSHRYKHALELFHSQNGILRLALKNIDSSYACRLLFQAISLEKDMIEYDSIEHLAFYHIFWLSSSYSAAVKMRLFLRPHIEKCTVDHSPVPLHAS